MHVSSCVIIVKLRTFVTVESELYRIRIVRFHWNTESGNNEEENWIQFRPATKQLWVLRQVSCAPVPKWEASASLRNLLKRCRGVEAHQRTRRRTNSFRLKVNDYLYAEGQDDGLSIRKDEKTSTRPKGLKTTLFSPHTRSKTNRAISQGGLQWGTMGRTFEKRPP
jgi:hypothetical protein